MRYQRWVVAALSLRRRTPRRVVDKGEISGFHPVLERGRHRGGPHDPYHGCTERGGVPGPGGQLYGAAARNFAVTCRHHLADPPRPPSKEYDDAVRQVRSKGIHPDLTGTLPDDLFDNQIVRQIAEAQIAEAQIAEAQGNDIAKNARLFALVNTAMGDAGVLAWSDKYFYDVWRPVLGIREHDSSSDPTGVGGDVLDSDADPQWLPLGAQNTNNVGQKNVTPNFPAYPSGHATFGAAAFQSVRQSYKKGKYGPDDLAAGLEFVSEELNGINVDNTGTVRQRRVAACPDSD